MNKDYFNSNNYDHGKHWHIGYYKDGYNIEAIAFLRLDNSTWDVFFNDFTGQSERKALFGSMEIFEDHHFGIFLFNAIEEVVETKFKQWVENTLLPFRQN